MGGSVVNYVKSTPEVIEWAGIDLSATPSNSLWAAYYCSPPGDARNAIIAQLKSRKEF